MDVKRERIGEKTGYYLIVTDEEFECLKPFLTKYNPSFLDGIVEEAQGSLLKEDEK